MPLYTTSWPRPSLTPRSGTAPQTAACPCLAIAPAGRLTPSAPRAHLYPARASLCEFCLLLFYLHTLFGGAALAWRPTRPLSATSANETQGMRASWPKKTVGFGSSAGSAAAARIVLSTRRGRGRPTQNAEGKNTAEKCQVRNKSRGLHFPPHQARQYYGTLNERALGVSLKHSGQLGALQQPQGDTLRAPPTVCMWSVRSRAGPGGGAPCAPRQRARPPPAPFELQYRRCCWPRTYARASMGTAMPPPPQLEQAILPEPAGRPAERVC